MKKFISIFIFLAYSALSCQIAVGPFAELRDNVNTTAIKESNNLLNVGARASYDVMKDDGGVIFVGELGTKRVILGTDWVLNVDKNSMVGWFFAGSYDYNPFYVTNLSRTCFCEHTGYNLDLNWGPMIAYKPLNMKWLYAKAGYNFSHYNRSRLFLNVSYNYYFR